MTSLTGLPAMGKPTPRHTIVHVSDTHFLAEGNPLFGSVDTDAPLRQLLRQLGGSGLRPELLLFTGDVADLGEADAYRRVRRLVEPAAGELGARVLWVMGNHDERARLRVELLDQPASADPVVASIRLGGLRVIALDTSVPGYHHGELSGDQLAWLRGELAEPAPEGTLIALHHPPVPTAIPLMPIVELQDQEALANAIEGSDVRAILGGHLHYATNSTFAGVPVAVAAATCYTMDAAGPAATQRAVAGGQSFTVVHVYDDRVVHSIVPIGDFREVYAFGGEYLDGVYAMSDRERLESFSRKGS